MESHWDRLPAELQARIVARARLIDIVDRARQAAEGRRAASASQFRTAYVYRRINNHSRWLARVEPAHVRSMMYRAFENMVARGPRYYGDILRLINRQRSRY